VSPTVTFGNSRDNFEISPTRTGAEAGKSATRTASLGLLKLDERETSLSQALRRLHHCWVACAPELGGDDPAGGLTVDSGVLNPELLGTLPGSKEWARGRLRDRIDATIAHEHEEARRAGITSRRSSTRQSPSCRSREGGQHILRAMQSKERLR
jgi:hypothetical protein